MIWIFTQWNQLWNLLHCSHQSKRLRPEIKQLPPFSVLQSSNRQPKEVEHRSLFTLHSFIAAGLCNLTSWCHSYWVTHMCQDLRLLSHYVSYIFWCCLGGKARRVKLDFVLYSKLVLHNMVPCGAVVCWYMFKSWKLAAHYGGNWTVMDRTISCKHQKPQQVE